MKQCRLLNRLLLKSITLCKRMKGQIFGVVPVKVDSKWIFWPLCPRTYFSWKYQHLSILEVIFCQLVSIKCTQESSVKAETLSVMLEASLILLNGWKFCCGKEKISNESKNLKISLKSLWFCFSSFSFPYFFLFDFFVSVFAFFC